MGTNFYWLEKPACAACGRGPDEGDHIGKRSAAGLYCWDCDETLCPGGKSRIHYGRGDEGWHAACPKCGNKADAEKINEGAAGVELGFAKPRQERPTGVRSTSSFSWAIDPSEVRRRCEEMMGAPLVVSEYGDVYTGGEFLAMLRSNCAVEFTQSIGQEFS